MRCTPRQRSRSDGRTKNIEDGLHLAMVAKTLRLLLLGACTATAPRCRPPTSGSLGVNLKTGRELGLAIGADAG